MGICATYFKLTAGCGDTFMWADGYSPSTNWGCRCCVPGDKGKTHGIWSVVKINGYHHH